MHVSRRHRTRGESQRKQCFVGNTAIQGFAELSFVVGVVYGLGSVEKAEHVGFVLCGTLSRRYPFLSQIFQTNVKTKDHCKSIEFRHTYLDSFFVFVVNVRTVVSKMV